MNDLEIDDLALPSLAEPEAYVVRSCHLLVRHVDLGEAAALRQLLVGLDTTSRCNRFGSAANDAALAAHADTALKRASTVIGGFVDDALRGVLEIYAGPPGSAAEAAIVVDQDWRRRGIGTRLVEAATQWACRSDVCRLRLIFSRHNWPMRQLARKANAHLDVLLGEMCADIPIPFDGAERPSGPALSFISIGGEP